MLPCSTPLLAQNRFLLTLSLKSCQPPDQRRILAWLTNIEHFHNQVFKLSPHCLLAWTIHSSPPPILPCGCARICPSALVMSSRTRPHVASLAHRPSLTGSLGIHIIDACLLSVYSRFGPRLSVPSYYAPQSRARQPTPSFTNFVHKPNPTYVDLIFRLSSHRLQPNRVIAMWTVAPSSQL